MRPPARTLAWLVAVACAAPPASRRFPDRPVAWDEHDDEDTPRPASSRPWEKGRVAHALREHVVRRVDSALAMTTRGPAADVNALDEVPCSTWFCPKNHLDPVSLEALIAGPPGDRPKLPLRIERVKEAGVAPGARVVDARGHMYLLKIDPEPWFNMSVGAELVGTRIFWAAGYNVAPAWAVDLTRADLAGDPAAIDRIFSAGAKTPDGKLRALAVAWIAGDILGGFDFKGRRAGDQNDRIPHQDRRSLRATWVLFAWTNYSDPSSANTVDSWVSEGGRRFVRHYIVDFGSSLGSWTISPKPPHIGHRGMVVALAGKDPQKRWREALRRHPEVGYLKDIGWRPESYRSNLRNPAHQARVPADEYWGAKVVTSFSDDQLYAIASAAGYREEEARQVARALAVRRDIIGRRFLASATAIERPRRFGDLVCFEDLALARGYRHHVLYRLRWLDAEGHTLARARAVTRRATNCLPIAGAGYRILELQSGARPARIHLLDGKVVGLEHE